MKLALILAALTSACGPPRDAAEPPRAEGITRCSDFADVALLGQPYSDDLSGLLVSGDVLWTHTDARREAPVIAELDPARPSEPRRTLPIGSSVLDPEDLASAGSLVVLADTGDNSGPGRCFRLRRANGACAIDGATEDDEEACRARAGTVWVRRTVAIDRGAPYRLFVMTIGDAIEIVATLEWDRYPGPGCSEPSCRDQPWGRGRHDAEAIFARRERYEDGTVGTSLYLVTKTGFPIALLLERQQRAPCRFQDDGAAIVFRLRGLEALRGRVRIDDRWVRVAELDLGSGPLAAPSALAVQITGASFSGNDLVLLSRARTLRWHVPADVATLDERFFAAHRPCIAASPRQSEAPKLEGIALGSSSGDARSWYVVSEEGDFAQDGSQALFRIAERWRYDGASFVRGDVDGNGTVDDADAARLRDAIARPSILACADAADANDDGAIDARDLDALSATACGPDRTEDALSCVSYPAEFCGR